MNTTLKKSAIIIMIITLLLSSGLSQVFADSKTPVTIKSSESNFGYDFKITFDDGSKDWLDSISKITVSGDEYESGTSQFSVFNNKKYYADPTSLTLYIGEGCTFSDGKADCTISSTGYDDVTIELGQGSYTATIKESSGSSEDKDNPGEEKPETEKKDAPKASMTQDNGYIVVDFDAAKYVEGISKVAVNDTPLTVQTSKIALNGKQYYIDKENNKLYLDDWNRAFKSGDIITISNPGYNDISLKASIVGNTVSFTEAGKEEDSSDPYQIHVRLVGTFEAAVVNQSGYDATTSASTNLTQNKNSNVNVEIAITQNGLAPTDADWKLLSDVTSDKKVIVDTEKTSLHIVNALTGKEDSSMNAIYSTYDDSVTLAGTPSKAGLYKIYVDLVDEQGRKATSNQLDFKVYTGNELLEDILTLDNSTKTSDGKYMYDMEPWTVSNFDNNDNTVTIPKDIKAWYGSHTSGTYGKLGYAIPSGTNPTQTLIVPSNCNVTLVNMDLLSSVKIVVEEGGTLTLRDSVVNGIIEVKKGGTFSCDYDAYSGKFLSGSSINGQLIMKDGSTLENARIKSNTNYIANGNEARQNDNPVVVTEGNVTIKGQVFIKGDEAATYSNGQQGLKVTNGALNITSGSTLAVYGGGYLDLTSNGGDAVQLDNGSIVGDGKLIAVGGAGMFGSGGNAVSGNGIISAKDVYLEGGASKFAQNPNVGKALDEGVTLANTSNRTLIDGQNVTSNADEINRGTMWNGVDITPDLSKYAVEKNGTSEDKPSDENNASDNNNANGNNNANDNSNGSDSNNSSANSSAANGNNSNNDSSTSNDNNSNSDSNTASSNSNSSTLNDTDKTTAVNESTYEATDNTATNDLSPEKTSVATSKVSQENNTEPQTSDDNNLILWSTVLIVFISLYSLIRYNRKKEDSN